MTTETTSSGVDIDAIRNDLGMRQQFIDLNRPVPTSLAHRIGEQATALLAKVDELTAELARVRADERNTIAADIENMPINLGDTGWKHLETKADEASYPPEWVRRRRSRDDFTTATIEVAYQYGYRQAAKVARGEVAR